MKCTFYCTADSYNMDGLTSYFLEKKQELRFYETVIHLHDEVPNRTKDIFIFPYGCVLFWDLDPKEEEEILSLLSQHAISPLETVIRDESKFLYSEETSINEEEDEILLESRDALIKLSFSHALSQSVKLRAFEDSTDVTIERNRHLPQDLARHGRIPLSRKKLSQKIGYLFAERNSINLHSEILDTPEFFWRRPRYEPYYVLAYEYMDIGTRLDILNRRLDAIHELYEILSNELNHRLSARIEVIIVILIAVEVLLVILNDLLEWV